MDRVRKTIKLYWWKITGALLVFYTIIGGLTINIPQLPIVEETVRNVFFHVSMWHAMIFSLLISVIYSLIYLSGAKAKSDIIAVESVNVALLLGFLGLATGMLWAKFTWGSFWVRDPKLNGAAVGVLVYLAYLVLRFSVENPKLKARLSAVYNIFAFVILILLIGILPRLADGSLHPGSSTETPFAIAKLQPQMYWVFIPAITGWILMTLWLIQIRVRLRKIENIIND